MSKYNKFIYALLTAIVLAIGSLILGLQEHEEITIIDWLQAISIFLGPFVVLVAPANKAIEEDIS